jgi:hypothetical protein
MRMSTLLFLVSYELLFVFGRAAWKFFRRQVGHYGHGDQSWAYRKFVYYTLLRRLME